MAGRLRTKLEPRQQQQQKMSMRLIKYSAVSAGLIGLIAGAIILYNNLVVTHETLAKTQGSFTNSGYALQFDGINDFVSLGPPRGTFPDKFTVMAWVKWNITPAEGNQWAGIFTANSTTTCDEGLYWLQHNADNSRFEFAVQTSKGRKYARSLVKPKKDVWYHVAGVYDGATIRLYVNGVEEGTTSHSGTIAQPKKDDLEMTVGEWASAENNHRRFNGVIDEVSAWNYAMNATDIRKYLSQKVPDKENGLLVNLPFDEGSGNSISSTDNSKYKGTVAGAVWGISGAPVSAESKYLPPSSSNEYEYTFSNGYTLQIKNLSQAPDGVLFYFLNDEAQTYDYLDYTFSYGTMGVYVISSSAISYQAKFFTGDSQTQTLTTSQKFVVLTRPSSDKDLWSTEPGVASLSEFSLNPSTIQFETSIGTFATPLPIVLDYFRGNPTAEGTVLLEWATASEKNNDYFTIERSADGKTFNVVAKIPGAGNSREKLSYNYTDARPLNGFSYYRLKQTDYDGKFEYSPLISISAGAAQETEASFSVQRVFPNPFTDKLTVEITSPADATIHIKLSGSGGTPVYEENLEAVTGTNTFQLAISPNLEKGIYLLTISHEGKTPKVMRVVKS